MGWGKAIWKGNWRCCRMSYSKTGIFANDEKVLDARMKNIPLNVCRNGWKHSWHRNFHKDLEVLS